jgi:predicted peroxiredoxin
MTGMATKMLKDQLDELDLPSVREFLDQIVAAGGHLWACRLSADMNKVDMDDLYEGVDDIINASDFIEMTDGAQLLFI